MVVEFKKGLLSKYNDFDSRLERQLKSEYRWVNLDTLRTLQKLQHFWCQKNQNTLLEPF